MQIPAAYVLGGLMRKSVTPSEEAFGKEDAEVFYSSKMAFIKSNSDYSHSLSFQNRSFTDKRERREGGSLKNIKKVMVLHTRVDRESSERKETDVGSW